jgi:hypothetical protein
MGMHDDVIGLFMLVKIFLFRRTSNWVDQETEADLTYRWWGEYGCYIGPVLALLIVMAIVLRYRTYKRWIWLMVGFGLIMVGNHFSFMPWGILKQLPVYKALRVPTRYGLLVMLCIAVVAAYMLEDLIHWLKARNRKRLARKLAVILTVLIAADLWSYGIHILSKMKHEQVEPVPVRKTFRQEPGNRKYMEQYVRANTGTVDCYEADWITPSEHLGFNLTSEAWPIRRRHATVTQRSWSPNRIELEVNAANATTIIYNMNNDKWWRTSVGDIVTHKGLLGIRVPAGTHSIVLSYEPFPFYIGAMVSAVSLLTVIGLLFWSYHRRKRKPPTPHVPSE